MKKVILIFALSFTILTLIGCSSRIIHLSNDNISIINRDIVLMNSNTNTLVLNRKRGDGLAIIKDLEFGKGVIELELKGENNPGKSFIGIAFNIQNDSTYEAIYFRPFNFKSDEKIRREHSVQYIFHPKNTWRFLRSNYQGQYEAEYSRQPSPDDWFGVYVKIDDTKVSVFDKKTNTELLSIKRLSPQVSNRIGFWTGFNSKGEFRNLKIIK